MATDQGAPAPDEQRTERTTMQVTIDGQVREIRLEGLSSFGELMERIERELVPGGRVVTSLQLNEEPLSMEQEELLYGFSLENVGRLELQTAEPRALAIDSLLHSTDYLPELSRALEFSAAQIRRGELDEGLEGLDACMELLQHFLAMLEGVRTVLQLDFARVLLESDEGGSVARLQQRLQEQAEALLAAAENEDWSAAGEVAAYDLSPLVYQFIAVMPLLLDSAMKAVPEYREEIARRARERQEGAAQGAWSQALMEGDEDGDEFDDSPDLQLSDADAAPRTFRTHTGQTHADTDGITEVSIDDLDDAWQVPRPGSKKSSGDPPVN